MKYVASALVYIFLIALLIMLAPVLFAIAVVAVILDLVRLTFNFVYNLLYDFVNDKEEKRSWA